MSKKQPKFYVVWSGREPGVYATWAECQNQINGFGGAKYKAFPTRAAAEAAFQDSADDHYGKGGSREQSKTPVIAREELAALGVDMTAWCVDAACQGNPGIMEYQGVDLASGVNLFHMGPYPDATVNIGEFLAIVHALALLNPDKGPTGADNPNRFTKVYSDSRTGISWVRRGVCRTKLPKSEANKKLFEYIERAEKWLDSHNYSNPVVKWETEKWGEIPADFGRK